MSRPESKKHYKAILEGFTNEYNKRVEYWRAAKRRDESEYSIQLMRDRADEISEERENWLNKYGHLYDSLPNE